MRALPWKCPMAVQHLRRGGARRDQPGKSLMNGTTVCLFHIHIIRLCSSLT